jgi:hypothetical protein
MNLNAYLIHHLVKVKVPDHLPDKNAQCPFYRNTTTFSLVVFLLLFSLSGLSLKTTAQVSVKDSVFSFSCAGITGGYAEPGGDLADRFGSSFNMGCTFFRKLKSNWIVGLQGDFIFGDQVKENEFLSYLATSQGQLISKDGKYSTVLLYERGWDVKVVSGKILPVLGPNKNSGLLLYGSVGFLQHKIRIESQGDNIPFLQGEYLKGYDRLTNGTCVSAFAGYINFGNRRRINFFAGFETTIGYTKSRRDFNFDTRVKDAQRRTDAFIGIKAGWIIPLYKKVPNTFYYD